MNDENLAMYLTTLLEEFPDEDVKLQVVLNYLESSKISIVDILGGAGFSEDEMREALTDLGAPTSIVAQRYIAQPVEVEAVYFNGYNDIAVLQFCPEAQRGAIGNFVIPTPEGTTLLEKGNYLIKGVEGEFYPCKRSIFLTKYQPYWERAALKGQE